MTAPKQPTTQVRQPPSDDTKTIRTNDPVTNAAEEKRAMEEQEQDDAAKKEAIAQQEEEAKEQEELFKQRQDLMKSVIQSNEGFVVIDEDNSEAVENARISGHVSITSVQSGPGGLEVEQRVMLTGSGYDDLRTAFGPSMGKK